MENTKKASIISYIIMVFKGVLVGFGAILPGVSGGTLCVVFGMYTVIIDLLTSPIKTLKENFFKLLFFIIGGGIGFVGLSGLANYLIELNEMAVTCAFVGFIIGTLPSLFKSAGEQGVNKNSYISLIVSFVLMLTLLISLKLSNAVNVAPNIFSFFLCGVVWGVSFIVPGLSSSTLLIFFGLYAPMLKGISTLSFEVIIPLGIGCLITMLSLSKVAKWAFNKWYSVISHIIVGIVIASTIAIFPLQTFDNITNILIGVVCIICGCIFSYITQTICDKLEEKTRRKNEF